MSEAKISVIVPVYNVEQYLRQCLDSVINQTFKDLEIICVDDCSPDNSAEILKEYAQKDSRVKIITLEKNGGLGNARNVALKQASAEYIMFLDSDDWLELYACELAYNKIKQNNNDFVFFNFYWATEKDGTFEKTFNAYRFCKLLEQKDINHINPSELDSAYYSSSECWYKIYNKEFLQKNNIEFLAGYNFEDQTFFAKVFCLAKDISVIDMPLINYRQRNTSITFDSKNWQDLIEARERTLYAIPQNASEVAKDSIILSSIVSLLYWFKHYSKIDKQIKKEFFIQLHDLLQKYDKDAILRLKERFNYQLYNNIVKSNSYNQFLFNSFLSKVFSIQESVTHKKYTIMGISISKNKQKDFALKPISFNESTNFSHYELNLFGIKLKIAKKRYRENNKLFNKYKKNNIDITTYPKATGQLRELQLANLRLFKFFDRLCQENNLKYWLDFGTLLGAVRHKGYIPWDDDIDISMMREDYEKVFDIVNNNKYNSDIYAEFYKYPPSQGEFYLLKIKHRQCEHLFVDIFPCDYIGKILPLDTRIYYTNELKAKVKSILATYPEGEIDDELIKKNLLNARKEMFANPTVDNEHSDITWGMDYHHHRWENWIHPHDMVFPLTKIEYEGESVWVPNNYKAYLEDLFGDYMSYPKDITRAHSAYIEFDDDFANINI